MRVVSKQIMYNYEYVGNIAEGILTKAGTRIANRFSRIVMGERGAYVEFFAEEFDFEAIQIPPGTRWRLTYPWAYYVEYRTRDDTHAKVYLQKRPTEYANYVIGRIYISPVSLAHFQRGEKV